MERPRFETAGRNRELDSLLAYEVKDLVQIMRNASDKRDWINRPDLRLKIRTMLALRHRQSLDPRRKSAGKGKGMVGRCRSV